eukprot:TRINITY_DN23293_c0_g3_i1.p1 TRINITY_DN23293_c0_g3~~TRINITY_DN23293_c0_g3_i1.p1  ORF type:complete len:721 (+),score=94.41 TRINITY_DN23293_c0_g3_i1:164-2326(+)
MLHSLSVRWQFLACFVGCYALTVQDIDPPRLGPSAKDCAAPANPIVRENCLPGNPATEWDINAAGSSSIQGFATKMSVAPKERLEFKVRTDSKAYRFDIYRLGYYGGAGARRVATFRPSVSLPQTQPECLLEESTLLVDCGNWAVSGAWDVPHDAVSGVYFARLTREDAPSIWRMDASEVPPSPKFANKHWDYSKMPPCGNPPEIGCSGMAHAYGAQRLVESPQAAMRNALLEPHASHAYFVVRDDSRQADILLQTMDTTWHAYNNYIAPSTYGLLALSRHNFTIPPGADSRRSYKRSYNTPLITRDIRAVNAVFHAEYPAIRWLEANGYDVTYWSGVDAHSFGSEIAKRARSYISVGHDEYWSGEQRAFVEAARDQGGVHLMFLSGNEVYWKVRWEASMSGEPMRTLVVYKESQESFKIDPDEQTWTGTFRDGRDINPEGPNPENSLTGTIFTVNAWVNAPLVVPGAFAALRFWRHTAVASLRPTQKAVLLKGLLGHEFDEDIDNGFRPAGLVRMSETIVDNVQILVDSGGCFDSGTATHRLVMYKAPSGALVFGAGTVQWAWGLDSVHDSPGGMPNSVGQEYDTRVGVDETGPEPAIQQAMVNVLADMSVQPATLDASLTRASASTDTEAPVVDSISVVGAPSARSVSAEASDIGGGVVGALEISWDHSRWHPMDRDGDSWKADLPSSHSGPVWVRAIDDSFNIGAAVSKKVEPRSDL